MKFVVNWRQLLLNCGTCSFMYVCVYFNGNSPLKLLTETTCNRYRLFTASINYACQICCRYRTLQFSTAWVHDKNTIIDINLNTIGLIKQVCSLSSDWFMIDYVYYNDDKIVYEMHLYTIKYAIITIINIKLNEKI